MDLLFYSFCHLIKSDLHVKCDMPSQISGENPKRDGLGAPALVIIQEPSGQTKTGNGPIMSVKVCGRLQR